MPADAVPTDAVPTDGLRLPHEGPLASAPLDRFLAAHVVPGLERRDPVSGAHTRLVPTVAGPVVATVQIHHSGHGDQSDRAHDAYVTATLVPAAADDEAVRTLRRWLGLDVDPREADSGLAGDPLLGPMVRARPGLRVPGAVVGLETALFAVLGQQVSLAAARTFAGRLVGAFGVPGPAGLALLPEAAVLADAGPEVLRRTTGVTGARARTLHAVATAVADGLDLRPGGDVQDVTDALLALPGIGPWTASYVALRVLGDRDAFLAGDLVLRRAMGSPTARQAEVHAEAWRPWRAHALLHLWTAAVFVPAAESPRDHHG